MILMSAAFYPYDRTQSHNLHIHYIKRKGRPGMCPPFPFVVWHQLSGTNISLLRTELRLKASLHTSLYRGHLKSLPGEVIQLLRTSVIINLDLKLTYWTTLC